MAAHAASRPRVVIVGLLPGQRRRIDRELGKRFDLRFLGASAQMNVTGCTHIVLMTKFISHQCQTAAYARFPRDAVLHCNGGPAQLRRLLEERFAPSER
jgi:hypothetical protein